MKDAMAYIPKDEKCRTCLTKYRNMVNLTADYIVDDELITMADILVTCTGVQISPNDNFPQFVCEICVREAIKAYSFKRQCERTDQILKSQENGNKSESYEIEDYYCCTMCTLTFKSIDELSEHLPEHDFYEQCSECHLKFKTIENLEKHIESEHKKNESHLCTFCDKEFDTEANLAQHIQKHTTDTLRAMRKINKAEVEPENDLEISEKDLDSNSSDEFDLSAIGDECEDDININSNNNVEEKISPASKILKAATEENADGLVQCISCPEFFKTQHELRKHTRKHKSYRCKLCYKVFTIVSNLRRHLRAHSQENVVGEEVKVITEVKEVIPEFKCICCQKSFSKRKMLSEHLKTHKEFSCSICTAKFAFVSNLRKHIRAHNRPSDAIRVWKQAPVEKRTCDICSKVFKYRPSMLKHRKKHNMNGKTCQYCNEVFENAVKLYKHMAALHQHEKNIVCTECGKTFFRPWNLKMHMTVHTGARPFMCEVCGMSFALQGNLSSHKRLHTGVKPYKCQTCGKGFTQQAALRSHEAGHSSRRDFPCPDCGKAFSRIGAMKNHRKRHDTAKPFACYMCDKRFTFSSERKRHMTTHTGERKYTCEFCRRAFNRMTNLNVHMRIHTRDFRFWCHYCDKGFVQAHGLKTHLLMHEKHPRKYNRTGKKIGNQQADQMQIEKKNMKMQVKQKQTTKITPSENHTVVFEEAKGGRIQEHVIGISIFPLNS